MGPHSLSLHLRRILPLFLLAACASAAAKDTWVEVCSPNFIVISNDGDKEARSVADQFEQFREVFHASFPQLRVDLGKPLIIFAVKNEDSLKILLPSFWEVKGHAHPAGIYMPGEERHFVALRTNVQGDNPYEVVYHEYTHALMNLNFRDLPLWLGEGLAELFGNTTIRDKDVQIGRVSPYHLIQLRQNTLIPIETLLTAGHDSPYYNEENRVSIFYAESWAITHYLMTDPDARKRNLLFNFLKEWTASGDQVQAARATFGDLKKFSQSMEGYARQSTFYVINLRTSVHGDPKNYTSRELPPSEVAAYRALLYVHTGRTKEAQASTDEALQSDPSSALAFEARGLLAYFHQDFPAAEAAFSRAAELNSSSYSVYYYESEARLRSGIPTPGERVKMIASLEKAVSLNPQFAPAYSALASLYSMQPDTYQKAFEDGAKAVKLEPGTLSYAVNYGYVLLNAGKTADAKYLLSRIQEAATAPEDKHAADLLAEAIASHENYEKQIAEYAEHTKQLAEQEAAARLIRKEQPPASAAPAPTSAAAKHANEPELAVEGIIASAECNTDSTGRLTLTVNHVGMKFLYPSLGALKQVAGEKGENDPPPCTDWKGKKVRLYFFQTKNKPYAGDLDTILFLN
jgi:Tfp pilus assembly protein PilF